MRLQNIASVLVAQSYTPDRFSAVKTALEKISNLNHRARATLSLLGALVTNQNKINWVKHIEILRANLLHAQQLSNWDCWMLKVSITAKYDYPIELFMERTKEASSHTESPLERKQNSISSSRSLS